MKKTSNVILFIVNQKSGFVHSTLNHHRCVNKILCLKEELHEDRAVGYARKEMEKYPIVRDITRKIMPDVEVVRQKKSTATQLVKYAYQFANRSNYLLLEQTSQLLNALTYSEIEQNEVNLEILKKSVNECMTREELAEHAFFEIHHLLSQILELQGRKQAL